MKNWNELQWKAFPISEVADIQSGQDIYDQERTQGDTPYITATAEQNGIGYFVGNQNETLARNCLSVNRNGSVGYSFFHPYNALFGNDTRKLIPKCKSKYVGFFLARCITEQRHKYGYGLKMGTGRLLRQKIMLPVTNSGTPDYEFMDEYMQQIEKRILKEYKSYIVNKPRMAKNGGNGKITWKPFIMNEIFDISSSIRLTKDDMIPGDRPFIGASDANNGITAFVGNTNSSLDSNVLGVNYNGSVVENFYHPYEAIFSDDVKRLHLKKHPDNKYVLLFIKSAILKQKSKYEYGYKFNGDRMARQHIMLPATIDGNPDFDYMEQQMRAVEAEQFKQYISTRLAAIR